MLRQMLMMLVPITNTILLMMMSTAGQVILEDQSPVGDTADSHHPEPSASSQAVDDTSTTSEVDQNTLLGTMWAIELLNYSLTSSNLFLTSFYDYNLHYLSSMRDNIKLVYHYVAARFLSLFLPANSANSLYPSDGSDNLAILSRLSWSAVTYYLYTLQTILFRIETIAILCLLFVFSLFFHRERVRPEGSELNPAVESPSTEKLLSKLLRCLNLTFLFGIIFALFEAALRGFRANDALTYQVDYGTAGVFSMQGRRPNMEDCFSLKNNIAKELGIEYFAVYDGHGGPNAALYAEKEIFECISRRIKDLLKEKRKEDVSNETDNLSSKSQTSKTKSNSGTSMNKFDRLTVGVIKTILHEEMISIDKRLVENFTKKSDISGTTALVAIRLLHSNQLLVANVGDSRGILSDWKGATIPLSFDHKPYQLKEYRRIIEAGGYITLKGVYRVNGILAISRALGDYPLKENRLVIPDPDILSFDLNELKPRFMIMASDGFWDTFSNDNAIRFVQNELGKYSRKDCSSTVALQIAKRLVVEAYTRESYDNITVIIVLFDQDADKANVARAVGPPSPTRKAAPSTEAK